VPIAEPAGEPTGGAERRFVVLDRDGTLIVERHYLADPALVELYPGTAAGLRHLRELGLGLLVITNQSAIGRGMLDEARLEAIHGRLRELLAREGVRLDGIYHCPHVPEAGCACRKPLPGLLDRAARDLGFDPRAAFVIGDKRCDLDLGRAVGATALLVRTGYGAETARELAGDTGDAAPNPIVDDLREAARVIERLLAGERASGPARGEGGAQSMTTTQPPTGATSPRDTIRRRLDDSAEVKRKVADACADAIIAAADLIAATFRAGGKLLLCGNGGSAADCQHMAAELVSRLTKDFERPALPAIALTTDTSFLTAFANDCGFEGVFERQVEALGKPGDALIAISTSGNSPNVIRALASARARGLRAVALTGEGGGRMGGMANVTVAVPSTSTQHIQEAHLAIEHILCELVERAVFPPLFPPV
jgi:D-sedoheptulose 7-phosphate isomerase